VSWRQKKGALSWRATRRARRCAPLPRAHAQEADGALRAPEAQCVAQPVRRGGAACNNAGACTKARGDAPWRAGSATAPQQRGGGAAPPGAAGQRAARRAQRLRVRLLVGGAETCRKAAAASERASAAPSCAGHVSHVPTPLALQLPCAARTPCTRGEVGREEAAVVNRRRGRARSQAQACARAARALGVRAWRPLTRLEAPGRRGGRGARGRNRELLLRRLR
jgi:hypothetical protein